VPAQKVIAEIALFSKEGQGQPHLFTQQKLYRRTRQLFAARNQQSFVVCRRQQQTLFGSRWQRLNAPRHLSRAVASAACCCHTVLPAVPLFPVTPGCYIVGTHAFQAVYTCSVWPPPSLPPPQLACLSHVAVVEKNTYTSIHILYTCLTELTSTPSATPLPRYAAASLLCYSKEHAERPGTHHTTQFRTHSWHGCSLTEHRLQSTMPDRPGLVHSCSKLLIPTTHLLQNYTQVAMKAT